MTLNFSLGLRSGTTLHKTSSILCCIFAVMLIDLQVNVMQVKQNEEKVRTAVICFANAGKGFKVWTFLCLIRSWLQIKQIFLLSKSWGYREDLQ